MCSPDYGRDAMKEIRDIITAFQRDPGQSAALATLVRARGSSYRRPGARMLVGDGGSTVGALSGGCLEEEVAAHALEVIASGQPALLTFDTRLRYGCHGAIDIFVEKLLPEVLEQIASAQKSRRECLLATVFENANSLGTRVVASPEEVPSGAFRQTILPALQLVLVGEGPDSLPLRALAAVLGWDVMEVEEGMLLPNEFDEWTAAIVKTHNYGRDYAALEKLLPMGLRYVALLGPRRRRDQLLHALLEAGVEMHSELFAPAGLDIGAESPEEIALAMVTEIQSTFVGAKAESLRERKSAIHLVCEPTAA
ncbi:MAG: XdhC family protein [Chthoniobacterales bacterium]